MAYPNISNIIAVASGKGGVGKSTISANLAILLKNKGYKVALLDADIYGPSIPKMFNIEDYKPDMKNIDNEEKMMPANKFGLKIMSIGFFFQPNQALIWRGPLATTAIKEMIHKTYWEDLDYLIIDLPPGTNDIHLTLVQNIKIDGAVIVTSPQQVAVADAIRAIEMFKNSKIDIPIVGIIENMSWFSPPELPKNKYYILGKDGGKILAQSYKTKLLGQIPILEEISMSGDKGNPITLSDNSEYKLAFSILADNFLTEFKKTKIKEQIN